MNVRDNQIIENTLSDFFAQIKSDFDYGYLGFDNGNSQTLFLDGTAADKGSHPVRKVQFF